MTAERLRDKLEYLLYLGEEIGSSEQPYRNRLRVRAADLIEEIVAAAKPVYETAEHPREYTG